MNTKINKTGFTLIELILSIAIIGIILISFIPLFVMSAKTNSSSESSLDSTYLGKDEMERAYEWSRTMDYKDLKEELIKKNYNYNDVDDCFTKEYDDKRHLVIVLNEEGNLIRVKVKIYKDSTMNKLEVQYESLYSWMGRSILSEK